MPDKLIRVFLGAPGGINVGPFKSSLGSIIGSTCREKDFVVETVSTDEIKRRKLSPEAVVDWLEQSDYHFILSHVHQGITGGVIWGAGITDVTIQWGSTEIEKQFGRLASHRGFPTGEFFK
jgi:hypothetical protein